MESMPKMQQQAAGKLRAQAAAGEDVEADQPVERAVQHGGGENGRGGHGRFAVGIRLPGVHGRQAGLGAVAEQRQDERQPHGGLVELRRVRRQHGPVQSRQGIGPRQMVARVVGQHGAEQRHREADAADHGVLPRGFERSGLAVERHQEDGGQRGGFDGHPHHSQIVGQRHQQHGEHEQRRQAVILAELRDGGGSARRRARRCARLRAGSPTA